MEMRSVTGSGVSTGKRSTSLTSCPSLQSRRMTIVGPRPTLRDREEPSVFGDSCLLSSPSGSPTIKAKKVRSTGSC